MKKNWLLTAMVILMSVSMHSQIWLKKTVYNNENAVIINEAAMDEIAQTFILYKLSLSINEQLKLEIAQISKQLEKVNLEVDFLKKDTSRLEIQKGLLIQQLANKEEQHAIDLIYYKGKSDNWLKNFLLGTGTGGLIVALLVIISK
ncbi:MAG TPA: hypothetical protein VLY84_00200 [Dysgonamonadaceae bacterium]|nr:hypothetical protein [Dysgonamonadaceae bacterium]